MIESMSDLKASFAHIASRVRESRTVKSLKVLDKNARSLVKKASSGLSAKEIRRSALEEYRSIKSLIKEQMKRLK